MGLVAELPPKLARGPAGRGGLGPRLGGTLSTHSTLGTWVLESRSVLTIGSNTLIGQRSLGVVNFVIAPRLAVPTAQAV